MGRCNNEGNEQQWGYRIHVKSRAGILEVGYDRKRRSNCDFKASGIHYQMGSAVERDLSKKGQKFLI